MIDFSNVRTIGDFSIELRDRKITYFGDNGEQIAWFPAWENADRDLKHFIASDVPLGSIDDPFDDRDEGWRIVIFEYAGFIFILEDDRPNGTRFPRRYRVPRDRYLVAWAAVINTFNPIVPLDEE